MFYAAFFAAKNEETPRKLSAISPRRIPITVARKVQCILQSSLREKFFNP